MTRILLKIGRAILKGGWQAFRLFLRHLATFMMAILFLIALLLGYRAWRAGFHGAIFTLIPLAFCLILITAIFFARRKIHRWVFTSASRSKAVAQKRIAKGMVQEGIDRGEAVLERGSETAQEALSTLAEEVKADWEHFVARPRTAQPQASSCPFCGHLLRPGAKFCDQCGRSLRLTCPRCGHLLRPGAKFCDHCGAPVT